MDWKRWTASNHALLDQWRELLAGEHPPQKSGPSLPSPPELLSLWNEVADEFLCVFETGRGCAYLSPSWERITGHAASASMGSDFYAHLSAQDTKALIAALQGCVAEGETSPEAMHPLQLRHADGTQRWYGLHIGTLRRLPSGQHQLGCRLRDLQEKHEAQEVLERAVLEKEQALKARSEFLNAMSHELRTPLNAILGFTQIMESGMFGEVAVPQYRDYLRHIRESGYELLAQIDDVMHIASVDSGQAVVTRDACDLHAVLAEAVGLHRLQAQEAQVAVECEVGVGDYLLRADRIKLLHAFSHVLANALQACRAGGRIRVGAAVNDSDELCVRVHDDGAGMSARKLQALIAALHRDDSWSARNANGLGLGLPLAQELVRMHGGYLTLESTPGEGSCVSLHLPAACVVRAAGSDIFSRLAVAF
jgi:PAS domain S-box-containing protein